MLPLAEVAQALTMAGPGATWPGMNTCAEKVPSADPWVEPSSWYEVPPWSSVIRNCPWGSKPTPLTVSGVPRPTTAVLRVIASASGDRGFADSPAPEGALGAPVSRPGTGGGRLMGAGPGLAFLNWKIRPATRMPSTSTRPPAAAGGGLLGRRRPGPARLGAPAGT